MKSNRICVPLGRKWLKILKIMKLFTVFMLVFVLGASAGSYSQNQLVSLNLHQCNVRQLFKEIREQTGLRFVFNEKHVAGLSGLDILAEQKQVKEVLEDVFRQTNLECLFEDEVIFVVSRRQQQQTVKSVAITGTVADSKGEMLPGVTVMLKGTKIGTVTDTDGRFKLTLPESLTPVLVFSFVGMKTTEVKYTGQASLKITLRENTAEMEEVVVTGIFERKAESFTGSTSTYKTEDLKMIGSQNVLQSLRTLDPSFHITPNNEYGSDPNRLPDIDIRGKTSVVNLKEEYAVDPNQPLFILDGFEVSLQTVVDLSMERVASVTILKDAASTAIYGSRAANGVVVVETKKPLPGKLRVSYNGDLQVTFPDLSDYNMMNASEKLEFERLAGVYNPRSYDPLRKYELDELYNERMARVKSGVDTYWLSEPVRTGIVHKHHLYAEGGDEAMRYGIGVNYTGTDGVMKQSGRDVLAFNIDLLYRKGKFSFNNKFSLDYTESENAPQAFSVYVQTNPYYEKDYVGNIPQYLEIQTLTATVLTLGETSKRSNPLYNASLNNLDGGKTMSFRNNFQAEWSPTDGLKVRGRISLSKSNGKTEVFKSPNHTDFDQTVQSERGSYAKTTADDWKYDGDMTLTYGKVFAERHLLNAVAGWNFASTKNISDSYRVVGFADDNVPNPAFSNQYAPESKATYNERTSRNTSFYANLNYSYDSRYLVDANIRRDGSSVFGVNRRFSNSWSVGLAWNLHNEAFIGEWADLLKLRASVGNLGNQNFTSYNSANTYIYNSNRQNMFGLGATVLEFGNPDLEWQKTMDYNAGADVAVLGNRLRVNVDVYKKVTDPMLISINVAPSVGKDVYKTNMGEQATRGISGTVAISPVYKPADRINLTISLNGRHQKQKFDKLNDRLELLNEELKKTSLQRYRDGGSPSDIWAVRSAGIDPMSGDEIFIKKDGSPSFDYDNGDEVIIGNSEAKLEGTIGMNFYYKGFSLSAYFRYRLGADYFNRELYSRIENITYGSHSAFNQDRRALYDRWQKVGDVAEYRNIGSFVANTYPMTSRYLQRENTISGESLSVGYDFTGQTWLQHFYLKSMSLRMNMNDIFRSSTVLAERGTSYPFARTVSFSLNVSF